MNQKERMVDIFIDFVRSGKMAGGFSEGCDCKKCDLYAKKIKRTLLKKLHETQRQSKTSKKDANTGRESIKNSNLPIERLDKKKRGDKEKK